MKLQRIWAELTVKRNLGRNKTISLTKEGKSHYGSGTLGRSQYRDYCKVTLKISHYEPLDR